MRKTLFLALFSFLSYPALASSPGMIEGPPGCDWEARIDSVTQKADTTLQLTLTKMIGTCMYEPMPCGKAGDKAVVATNQKQSYAVGQTIHLWVSGDTASLEHPACTRTPIAR